MTHDVALAGARLEPLGSYLKAMGAFRLVAEQAEPGATCRWVGDTLHLRSTLDADALVDFFVERYVPTPVVVPWNSDAGFKDGTSKNTQALRAVEQSDDPRFVAYQRAIAACRRLLADPRWADLDKEQRVALTRNVLPDDALDWLDAAVVLRPEGAAFPLLLGSGGNLGRWDLSPNFMARLLTVLDQSLKAVHQSGEWLRHALFASGAPTLRTDSAGQYQPGAAGGVRAGPVGKVDALTNPWDFVLLIEGALIWAAGVARRLGGATAHASIPFSVQPSSVGYASGAPGERAKGELWAPVWAQDLDLPGLRRLFAEGRISWSGSQARTATDAVRALASLGVDAGLDRFVRHVVADRLGQSPLAVTVGTHPVRHQPGIDVLGDLDPWIVRLKRVARAADAPAGVVRAALVVERAIFEAAADRPGELAARLQSVLHAVAGAEAQVGRSETARSEGSLGPVPWLDPGRWLAVLDDGTAELRLAASIAIARDEAVRDPRDGAVRFLITQTRPEPSLRRGQTDRFGRVAWSLDPPRVQGFGVRSLDAVLADVLVRRSRAERSSPAGGDDRGVEVEPWYPFARDVAPGDAEALAAGAVDLDRLGYLLSGLLLLRPDPRVIQNRWRIGEPRGAVSPGWRLLAPFYTRHPLRTGGPDPGPLRPLPHWAALLTAGRSEAVFAEALTRLCMGGRRAVLRSPSSLAAGTSERLLAASLLASPSQGDAQGALDLTSDPQPEQGASS